MVPPLHGWVPETIIMVRSTPSIVDLSTNANFQPDGTLLASATSDFTTFALNTGYDPDRVLFRCDAADVDQLYEMYATNGDSTYGGKYEDGTIAGNVPYGYATTVMNVVIRFTNLATGSITLAFGKADA